MSEVSNRVLMQALDQPPEMDDPEEMDELEEDAIYESSMVDIENSLGDITFKDTYINLLPDIQEQPFGRRRIFCQRLLERIYEIYDFSFSVTVDITTEVGIENVLSFVEFLEYDNVLFLSLVWEMFKTNLIKTDIESFCRSKENAIIKEVEEQLQTHYQSKLIANFLRTYYKEKFIEWFIRETERSKTFIQLEILEREGKLNG
jgi:hypothetical protein